MSSKCFHTSHGIYLRGLYHSGSVLVQIPTNESVYHPRSPKIQLWNPETEVRWAVKKDERPFNYDFKVFVYILLVMYKVFVSFRKCLGTNTPQTSPFTTPDCQKSSSETPKRRYVGLYKRMSPTSIVFVYITLVIYKVFVSFRKCLGTNTPWTSLFTTPEHQKSSSETPKQRYVKL